MGVPVCAKCPAGSWSSDFQTTACTVCPSGTWTHFEGSLHEGDCTPSWWTHSSARVTIRLWSIDFWTVDAAARESLAAAYAEDLAQACQIGKSSVVDLRGKKSRATFAAHDTVEAFLTVPTGSSANDLAALLYTDSFHSLVMDSTAAALRSVGREMDHVSVRSVTISPEEFVPIPPTTTTVTTTTTVAPTTTTKAPTTQAPTTTTAALEVSRPARVRPTQPATYHKEIGPSTSPQPEERTASGAPSAALLLGAWLFKYTVLAF